MEKPYEQEKHVNKLVTKINNRKMDERNYCQISFEHKHCRTDYDDCSCDCKRRRLRNHNAEMNTRNCDANDNRKLWVNFFGFMTDLGTVVIEAQAYRFILLT